MNITIRHATRDDIPAIVSMLADDTLGQAREKFETPLPKSYYDAFDKINSDPNNLLIVAEINNEVIGTLQLTFITHLTYQGSKRAEIEGVRVAKNMRSKGIGKLMLEWAIEQAKQQECRLVQLTTNKKRADALEFYKKLGFINSHEGLKLHF